MCPSRGRRVTRVPCGHHRAEIGSVRWALLRSCVKPEQPQGQIWKAIWEQLVVNAVWYFELRALPSPFTEEGAFPRAAVKRGLFPQKV